MEALTAKPMALTRDFKETVNVRAERDVAIREALLTEAVEQHFRFRRHSGHAGLVAGSTGRE
jgi:hypothetical protein